MCGWVKGGGGQRSFVLGGHVARHKINVMLSPVCILVRGRACTEVGSYLFSSFSRCIGAVTRLWELRDQSSRPWASFHPTALTEITRPHVWSRALFNALRCNMHLITSWNSCRSATNYTQRPGYFKIIDKCTYHTINLNHEAAALHVYALLKPCIRINKPITDLYITFITARAD